MLSLLTSMLSLPPANDHLGKTKRRTLYLTTLSTKKRKKNQFRRSLNVEGRQRRDRNLIRSSLLDPNESPWSKCYESGDDGSLITVTGFDHDCFAYLLEKFEPLFFRYTPWCSKHSGVDGANYRKLKVDENRGKKRIVTASCILGLTLAWFRFRGAEFVLQGWFGLTGTQCNVWLRFGRRMLLKILLADPDAQVKFPDNQKIAELQEAIGSKYPTLKDVFCLLMG